MEKSIAVIFFFSMFFFNNRATGQSCDSAPYRHIYYNKGFNKTQVRNFSFASNNDIYLVGSVNQDVKNSNLDVWLMRTTFHGTPLWSKAIGTTADETINSIGNTKKGEYIFAGNTKYNAAYNTCWLAKIDSSGNPLWSLELKSSSGTLYQVEKLDNGDFVAVGTLYLQFKGDGKGNINSISHSSNFIIRIDSNGKVIWQRSFYHNNKESLRRVLQITDGNFITAGIVLDSPVAYVLKINQYTGDIIWSNQYEKPDNNYIQIKESNDKSLELKTGSSVYFLTADGKFKPGSYQVNLFSGNKPIKGQAQDMGASGANEIYYVNIKPNPVVFSVNSAMAVQWARIYNFNSSKDLSLGGARIYKNNIYLSGSYRGDNISDTASNEQLAYLLKASMNGETFCSDTSSGISFKVSDIPPGINTSYTWIDEGAVTPEFISMYSKNIEPVRVLDCTQQSCCNDVALTHKDEICDNSFYKLPGGAIATKPGFYTARMNTFKGCDSIIYTILSPGKQINLSLSSDTCLKDNKPVVFSLPVDSSIQYHWQDGSTNTQYTANFPGQYWITAINACYTVTDSINVHDNCAPAVFIPSAFTPNNDGLNDVFRIPDINGQHFINLNIYNRFGQLIFHSEDPHKGWDGTINNSPQAPGTYIYLLNYSDIEDKLHLLKGTIVLIR